MTEPQAEKQVPILAALAQATRLQILDRVSEAGPEGVVAGEIARAIRCPASTLSFHLKELSRTGVLEARPAGRFIHYSLRRPALQALRVYRRSRCQRSGNPRAQGDRHPRSAGDVRQTPASSRSLGTDGASFRAQLRTRCATKSSTGVASSLAGSANSDSIWRRCFSGNTGGSEARNFSTSTGNPSWRRRRCPIGVST